MTWVEYEDWNISKMGILFKLPLRMFFLLEMRERLNGTAGIYKKQHALTIVSLWGLDRDAIWPAPVPSDIDLIWMDSVVSVLGRKRSATWKTL